MNNLQFIDEVEKSYQRSVRILEEKEKEYSEKDNRLSQFHEVAALTGSSPCKALVGMAAKHFTSIALMSNSPYSFSPEKWDKKITGLRNYTFLLDALLRDMEV